MSHEQQLLFALLAHQNDFITQAELLAAFSKWLVNKWRPLPELMVEDGVLSADDKDLLSRLVSKHLEKFSGDATISLANLSGVSSIAEELRFAAQKDSDALATVSFLHGRHGSTRTQLSGESAVKPIKIESDSSRFRIIKEHARGGLGVVFVAEDSNFKREVALKQIRQDRSSQDIYRHKFTQEAEVTGQLEHPGIVPVYALGSDPQGRPYYAMRFIRGEDLKSRIANFHADVKQGKHAYDGPELRGLLRRFIDVCNAVDYAHDRGVLHRDLKPGNVMLGKYGETLVVDWGLAKSFGQKLSDESQSTQSVLSELPVAVDNSDDQATEQGAFLGTAVYAPPEQLMGQLDRLCPQSDVFALGVILFELLSGQLPWKVRFPSARALADHVLQNEAPKPIERRSGVPRPLNALCVRALEPKIEDRYSSAKELRKDIEHWLDDELVTAYREPVIDRFQRWTRKNKGLYSLAVGTLVTLTIASSVIYTLQTQANEQIAKQRDAAELSAKEAGDERDKAEQLLAKSNFNLSLARWEANRTGEAREYHAKIPEKYRRVEWDLAKEKFKGSDLTCVGHTDEVTAVKVSHDGSFIVSASKDGTIRKWDAISGESKWVVSAHEKGVNSIALSQDSKRIFSGGADHAVKAWDASSGASIGTLYSHSSQVVSLEVNSDGDLLASCAGNGIELWSTKENISKGRFENDSQIFSLDFGPDPKKLLVGAGRLFWLDVTSRHDMASAVANPKDLIRQVSVSSDGAAISVAWLQWNCKQYGSESLSERMTMMHSMFRPQCVAYSPNGNWIATGAEKVRIWDARKYDVPVELNGHEGIINCIDWFPDCQRVVSGSSDNTIRVWDSRCGRRLMSLCSDAFQPSDGSSVVGSISTSDNAEFILATNFGGQIQSWDVNSQQLVCQLHGKFLNAQFIRGTTNFLAAAEEGNLVVFDVAGNRIDELIPIPGEKLSRFELSKNGDSAVIATGPTVALWSISSKSIIASHQCNGTVDSLAIDEKGEQVAIGVGRTEGAPVPSVVLWKPVDDSVRSKAMENESLKIISLRFNHSGDVLAVSAGSPGQLNQIQLVDSATLKTKHAISSRISRATGLAFSLDDSRVFSSWWDKTVHIHDVHTGDEVFVLDGPSRNLQSIAIDQKDALIAAGGSFGEVFLWASDTDNESVRKVKARLDESWQARIGNEATSEKVWFAAAHAFHTLLEANLQSASAYYQLHDSVDKWISSSKEPQLAKFAAQQFIKTLAMEPGTDGAGDELWQVADQLRMQKREIADRYYELAIERSLHKGIAVDVVTQARVIWLAERMQSKNEQAEVERLFRYLPESIDRKKLEITSEFIDFDRLNTVLKTVWNLGFQTTGIETHAKDGQFEMQVAFQTSSMSELTSALFWGYLDREALEKDSLSRISQGYISAHRNELEIAGKTYFTVLLHRTNKRRDMIEKGDQLHQSLRAKFLNGRYSESDKGAIAELADCVSQFKKSEWLCSLGLAYSLQGKDAEAVSVIEQSLATGTNLDSAYILSNRLNLFLATIKLGDKTRSTKAGIELFNYIAQNSGLPYSAVRQTLIDNAAVIAENSEVNETSITALYRLAFGISRNLYFDFEPGLVWLNRALTIGQQLRKDGNDADALDWMIADVEAYLCGLQARMERNDEAIANGIKAYTTFKEKLNSSDNSHSLRAMHGLASLLNDLGDAYVGKIDTANALATRVEAASIYRELLASDADNVNVHLSFSIALERLGMSLESSSPQAALQHYEEGLRIASEAIDRWPNSIYLGRHCSIMCRHAAEAHLKLGNDVEAIVLVERGLANLQRMRNSGFAFDDITAVANALHATSAFRNSDPTTMLPFVGKYQYGTAIMTISIEKGQLFAQVADQPKQLIFPTGKNVFRWLAVEGQVEFVQDDDGFVTMAKHTRDGTTFDAPRLK